MLKKAWGSVAVILTIAVLFLCLYEFQSLPSVSVKGADKYVHVIMHFSLYFAWWMALDFQRRTSDFKLLFSLLLFGLLIEVLQEFCTERRGYDLWDVLANFFGALLALGVATIFRTFRNKIK